MEARFLLPGLLACALSCAAVAAEENNAETGTAETAPEAIEHVEVVAYPVPEVTTTEEETDRYLVDEQFREQRRQDLLRKPNRRALMSSMHTRQLQQLEAFRVAGERQAGEALAQDQAAQATQKPQQLEPAALYLDAQPAIESEPELDKEATAVEPAQDNQLEDATQEPS